MHLSRLLSAFVLFSQVTRGASDSYQMAVVALFAALEAMFTPNGSNKAKTLSSRVGTFLRNFSNGFDIEGFVYSEYNRGDRNIVHGVQDISIFSKLNEDKLNKFGKLHEITRLALLGFLSIGNDKLYNYYSKDIPNNIFDNLIPASGDFMHGQMIYV